MATDQQVQHYTEQAAQARKLIRRITRRPDLSALAGQWQGERRCALALLRAGRDRATEQADWDAADAQLFAVMDVENALRERAQATIAESVRMPFAHW